MFRPLVCISFCSAKFISCCFKGICFKFPWKSFKKEVPDELYSWKDRNKGQKLFQHSGWEKKHAAHSIQKFSISFFSKHEILPDLLLWSLDTGRYDQTIPSRSDHHNFLVPPRPSSPQFASGFPSSVPQNDLIESQIRLSSFGHFRFRWLNLSWHLLSLEVPFLFWLAKNLLYRNFFFWSFFLDYGNLIRGPILLFDFAFSFLML